MALVRLGRPTFLGDTALSLVFGATGGLVVTAVVALADFPEWGETLLSFLVVFSGFFPTSLLMRLFLHIGIEYVNHGLDASRDRPRSVYLNYSLLPMRFGAGSAGAAAVLSLAFLLATGEAFPG